MRSVRTWIRKNNAPLVVLGRNTYIPKQFITELIKSALGANYVSQGSSGDIRKNKYAQTNNPAKPGNVIPKRSETKHRKNSHSKAATRLLKNIKLG